MIRRNNSPRRRATGLYVALDLEAGCRRIRKSLEDKIDVLRAMGSGQENWLELIWMEVHACGLQLVLQGRELFEIAVSADVAIFGELGDVAGRKK